MTDDVTVAQLLKAARVRRGESLRRAAESLGVDPSHLLRVESGAKPPSLELQSVASDYYGIDRDQLALASGGLPSDVVAILRDHPELLEEIRNRYARR